MRSTWACSTTRTWPRAWAEHGEAAQAVGAIFDWTRYSADGTVGAGDPGRRREGISSAPATSRRSACPAATRGGRAVADGLMWLVAAAGLASRLPEALGARGRARLERGWVRLAGEGFCVARDHDMGRVLRRGLRGLRLRTEVIYEGQAAASWSGLRPRGGGLPASGDGELIMDARETVLAAAALDSAAGLRPAVVSAASTTAWPRPPRACVPTSPAATGLEPWCCPAGSPGIACWSSGPRAAGWSRAPECSCRSACPLERTGGSLEQGVAAHRASA